MSICHINKSTQDRQPGPFPACLFCPNKTIIMSPQDNYKTGDLLSPEDVGKDMSWDAAKIEAAKAKINDGIVLKVSPFYSGNTDVRRNGIVYNYSDEELQEIYKCANDIVYFANKYAVVMTDDGLQNIKLRDYQIDMLRHMQNNRFSILLAARQIGKCFLQGKLETISNLTRKNINIEELYNNCKAEKTFAQKLKFKIYKLIKCINK